MRDTVFNHMKNGCIWFIPLCITEDINIDGITMPSGRPSSFYFCSFLEGAFAITGQCHWNASRRQCRMQVSFPLFPIRASSIVVVASMLCRRVSSSGGHTSGSRNRWIFFQLECVYCMLLHQRDGGSLDWLVVTPYKIMTTPINSVQSTSLKYPREELINQVVALSPEVHRKLE